MKYIKGMLLTYVCDRDMIFYINVPICANCCIRYGLYSAMSYTE